MAVLKGLRQMQRGDMTCGYLAQRSVWRTTPDHAVTQRTIRRGAGEGPVICHQQGEKELTGKRPEQRCKHFSGHERKQC